jgi:hypothetical protein
MAPDETTVLTVDLPKKLLWDSVHQLYEMLANKPSATNESGGRCKAICKGGDCNGD